MSTTARALTLPEELRPARREWALFVRRLGRRRTALFGAIVVALVVITAIAAPWVSSEGARLARPGGAGAPARHRPPRT
jgi:hypothetical protein